MTDISTFVYFAYGSNMSSRRLRARTPSAQPLGTGSVAGHRLAWHKAGADGSAKCDMFETGSPDDCVWGVLYEIEEAERFFLDQAEGLGHAYEFKIIEVQSERGVVQAGAYYATDVADSLQPFDWYLAYVVGGADEHGLPTAYRDALRVIAALEDPDAERRQVNFLRLGGQAG